MIGVQAFDLAKRFGEKWGVRNITFVVKEGELAVIAGPNGAGKTTTVKIFATIYRPTRGRALVLGYDTILQYKIVRRKIAYMPQGYRPFNDLTPYEAIKWNLVSRGWSLSDASRAAEEWLKILDLWEVRDKTCWRLSVGQRVRVAVAMTLSTGADVMFLDEPTVGLDVEIKHTVWKAIRESVSSGSTIILTTHDMKEAELLADKVVMINKGVTVIVGRPRELIEKIPYRYRVIVKTSKDMLLKDYPSIDLGDRVILYARSRKEALNIIEEQSQAGEILGLEKVGLEDAFLHIIGKGVGNGAA